MVGSSIF
ncbi:hypothetical protein VCCP104417_1578, partial [Vibrio cholerae CP1044(17)]